MNSTGEDIQYVSKKAFAMFATYMLLVIVVGSAIGEVNILLLLNNFNFYNNKIFVTMATELVNPRCCHGRCSSFTSAVTTYSLGC